jgi:hypothetical protein
VKLVAFHRTAGPRVGTHPLAGALAALLLCASCSATGQSPPQLERDLPTEATTPTSQPSRPGPSRSQPSRPPTTSDTVTLSFGGDVMFEGDLERLLESPDTSLAPIRAPTGDADFTMVNLESALTTRGTPDPKSLEAADNRYHFRTSASALSALEAAGVDAVSVANNHGADFGARGLADTLRAKSSGVLPVIGVGRNRADAFTPHRVTLKGQRFAFFAADDSFLESTAPQWEAGATTPGLAAARGPGRTALINAVKRAAAEGAVPVVYLHWGKENSVAATAAQQSLAGDLSLAGAAAVVGTHTHRLQGAGWLGPTYVAYGLGNFIWYHGISGADTGLLDLSVRDGRVVADDWRPALIPREGGLPRFLSGASQDRATAAWRRLRKPADLAARPPAAPRFTIAAITPALAKRMASSYRPGCPVPLEDLRYLRLSHWDFDGRVRQGELVIAAKHAKTMVEVFGKLYEARFPLQRMELVSEYDGDDDKSMKANNTSGFNCRTVAGTTRWSQHSFGAAVDLNPVQNPYVTSAGVSPAAGEKYAEAADRRASVKGLIGADSVVVEAFRDAGWEWGGDWSSPKDYQHFSAAGS